MKRARGELEVREERGIPRAFRWQGRCYAVDEVLERWRETGRWWRGEAPKLFFRVETGGGIWEIYLDTRANTWHLYRAYD